jgi:signal peptidase I
MSTVVLAAISLSLMLTAIVLWVFLLRVGLRWAKAETIRSRRIVATAVLIFVVELAVACLAGSLEAPLPGVSAILSLIVSTCLPVLIIAFVFKLSPLGAFKAWLPTLLSPIVPVLLVLLVVKPFLLEAFQSPSNAMAPTLLGNHWLGVCEDCGGPAFCSPPIRGASDEVLMICRDHFHITQPIDPNKQVRSPDKFLIAKYLKPRRWDLVVFRFPMQPSTLYVMRLVGMPGEEITIREGRVWANGTMLELPESLREIQYTTDDAGLEEAFGSESQPAKLGHDEYFVLGDFTRRSNDSRYWHMGALGNAPSAVPEANIVGVVTHIYWPMHRWRCFR